MDHKMVRCDCARKNMNRGVGDKKSPKIGQGHKVPKKKSKERCSRPHLAYFSRTSFWISGVPKKKQINKLSDYSLKKKVVKSKITPCVSHVHYIFNSETNSANAWLETRERGKEAPFFVGHGSEKTRMRFN